MNKHLASAAVIVSMLALVGGCNEEAQPQKPTPQFGVAQLSKVYQESNFSKAGAARAEALESQAMEKLTVLQKELEEARAGKDEAKVAKMEKDLQAQLYFLQGVIKQDQEHVMSVVQTELSKAFEKYRQEHGLFGVFSSETMLASGPEVDITEAMLTEVNQITPDFGALPSLEMPPLPEPANAESQEEAAAPDAEAVEVEIEAPAANQAEAAAPEAVEIEVEAPAAK